MLTSSFCAGFSFKILIVLEYFNLILFYTILCEYRSELAQMQNYLLDNRQYTSKGNIREVIVFGSNRFFIFSGNGKNQAKNYYGGISNK